MLSYLYLNMVWAVVTNPSGFFRKRADELSLWPSAVVVFLAGLASVLSTFLLVLAIPNEGGGMGSGILVILSTFLNAPISFGWVLLQWAIYTVILHLVAYVLNGDGALRDTVIVVGWGFIPIIILNLLNPVFRYLLYGDGAGVIQIQMLQGLQQSIAGQATLLVAFISFLFGLWQAVIWGAGIRHTHRLSIRRAVVVVGIPVVLGVALTIGSTLLTQSFP